jgi:hypothetical protein
MIGRRDFITLLGGTAAAWPLAARAQQGDRVRRIGVLMGGDGNDPAYKPFLSAFTQALADFGWTVGRNVQMDLRWGGGDSNRIGALAQELVSLQPDIIVTVGTPATVAVQRETRTISIVFAGPADPVASGIVTRLDRPSGNVTGFASFEASLGPDLMRARRARSIPRPVLLSAPWDRQALGPRPRPIMGPSDHQPWIMRPLGWRFELKARRHHGRKWYHPISRMVRCARRTVVGGAAHRLVKDKCSEQHDGEHPCVKRNNHEDYLRVDHGLPSDHR